MAELFPGPVLTALRQSPTRVAIEDSARTVSNAELLAITSRIASGLRQSGLGRGSTVGLILPPSPEAYAAQLAAHSLGCVVAPARPGWSPEQRSSALDELDVVIVEVAGVGSELALDDLLCGSADADVQVEGEPDAIARLTFTSGSTGRP